MNDDGTTEEPGTEMIGGMTGEEFDRGEAAYSGMFPTAFEIAISATDHPPEEDAEEPDEDVPGEDDADNS